MNIKNLNRCSLFPSWSAYGLSTPVLTPWSRVLPEKLTGFQLVNKFPAFHGTRRFITAFTSAHLDNMTGKDAGNILSPRGDSNQRTKFQNEANPSAPKMPVVLL
jgi:hypothetical protein